MDIFTKEIVLTALREMFKNTSFSICTIDKCLKLTNSIPDAHDYDCLSALHCISWKDMSSELRQAVFDKTINMFSCEGFDLSALEMIFNKENAVFELNRSKRKKFKLLG